MWEVLAAQLGGPQTRSTGGYTPPAVGGGLQAGRDPYLDIMNRVIDGSGSASSMNYNNLRNYFEPYAQQAQQQLTTMNAMQAQLYGQFPPLKLKLTFPGEFTMLNKLKYLQDALKSDGVDELIVLSAFARSLFSEYGALQIPVPTWLADNHALLTAEIATRYRAARLAELKKAEKDLEELRSREERKVATEEKLVALRSELGLDVAKSLPLSNSQVGG